MKEFFLEREVKKMEWAGFATVVAVQVTSLLWMVSRTNKIAEEVSKTREELKVEIESLKTFMTQMMLEHIRLDHGKDVK